MYAIDQLSLAERFIVGAALYHIDRSTEGHAFDHGFDYGEFSSRPRPGENEAMEVVYATDLWHPEDDPEQYEL